MGLHYVEVDLESVSNKPTIEIGNRATGSGYEGDRKQHPWNKTSVASQSYRNSHAWNDLLVARVWLKLIGGLEHFLFSHILGIIIPID